MIPVPQDPNNPLMMPGMKPPPPSPSLGFQLWASAPESAMKVQPSMIAPNAPLQPNAQPQQPAAQSNLMPPQKPPMALASPPQIAPKQSALMPPGSNVPLNLSTPMQTPGMASSQPAPADASLPDAPMAKMNPYAPPAVQSQGMKDRGKLQQLQTEGAGLNKIKNPWLRGLARAGDIAGTILAPNIAAALPGTTLHNRVLQGQQTDRIGQDDDAMKAFQDSQQNQANLARTQAETDKLLHPAPEKPESVQQLYSDAVADAMGRGVDPNKDPKVMQLADSITSLQRVPASKEPQRDDRAIQIYAKPPAQRTPEENAYLKGYETYVQKTKVDPGTARMQVLMQMPTAIADPNHPGNLVYTTRQGAIGQGAPGGIDTQVPLNLTKDFTSGADAKTLTNINTADAHIQQLGQIAKTLQNGDIRTLNELGNAWASQTGSPAPMNFQMLKTALAAEIAKTTAGGVATVEETKEISQAINAANSPAQLAGVAATAQGIMHSKREQLKNQFTMGIQGQPNFGNPMAPPQQPGGPKVGTIEDGHRFKGGNPADPNNWEKVKK